LVDDNLVSSCPRFKNKIHWNRSIRFRKGKKIILDKEILGLYNFNFAERRILRVIASFPFELVWGSLLEMHP
jgi:hypothetical protein